MTTIFAIVAGYIFYTHSIWWAFAVVLIVGLIQASTKSTMTHQYRLARSRGFTAETSTDAISNVVTQINMVATFVIWGFGIYAVAAEYL